MPVKPPPLRHVLVVIDAEGWAEVYAAPGVVVQVLEMPAPGFEHALWDQYKEIKMSKLPKPYQDLQRVKFGCARGMTWQTEFENIHAQSIGEGIERARERCERAGPMF